VKHLIITIALASLASLLSAGCSGRQQEDPAPQFYERITSADKLILASMTVTKTATVSDANRGDNTSFVDHLKIGSRVAAYSYDTYLRAFIDLSEMQPSDIIADKDTRTLTVILPPIRTEAAGRDATLREEHYRVTGFRSEIDPRERAALKEQMNASLMAEMEADPRFEQRLQAAAKERITRFIAGIAEAEGYTPVITFRPSNGMIEK